MKSLKLLDYWLQQIEAAEINRMQDISAKTSNEIYEMVFDIEMRISECYVHMSDNDKVECYTNLAIVHVKKVTVTATRVSLIYYGLIMKLLSLYRQSKYIDCKTLCEECYNLVTEVFNPIHELVLKAASILIKTFIKLGEFYEAERYSRIYYEASSCMCICMNVDIDVYVYILCYIDSIHKFIYMCMLVSYYVSVVLYHNL